jgi:anti-anti-sigma regulatory factor
MITSYVTPQRSILYLALVGPLDDYSAHDLVNEYYERHTKELRQCILDLGGADYADEDGLNVLHRLALMTEVDGVEFAAVSRGSAAESEIAEAAKRYWVNLVDGKNLPFSSRRAS